MGSTSASTLVLLSAWYTHSLFGCLAVPYSFKFCSRVFSKTPFLILILHPLLLFCFLSPFPALFYFLVIVITCPTVFYFNLLSKNCLLSPLPLSFSGVLVSQDNDFVLFTLILLVLRTVPDHGRHEYIFIIRMQNMQSLKT